MTHFEKLSFCSRDTFESTKRFSSLSSWDILVSLKSSGVWYLSPCWVFLQYDNTVLIILLLTSLFLFKSTISSSLAVVQGPPQDLQAWRSLVIYSPSFLCSFIFPWFFSFCKVFWSTFQFFCLPIKTLFFLVIESINDWYGWNKTTIINTFSSESFISEFSYNCKVTKFCQVAFDIIVVSLHIFKDFVHYIFASLFMSKREHLWNKEKCFLFHFESSFRSWGNQILTFQIFKCHDVIKCLIMKHETNIE